MAALYGKFQGALWAPKQFNLKDLDGRPNIIFREPFGLPNILAGVPGPPSSWSAQATKSPWKSIMYLKSPWELKNCWISLKSPWIFHKSPWIFLKAPWIKITFVKKKIIICFVQRNDWKHSNTQIFLGDHESLFLWFRCSAHGSFSVIWRTVLTFPYWRIKVLQ